MPTHLQGVTTATTMEADKKINYLSDVATGSILYAVIRHARIVSSVSGVSDDVNGAWSLVVPVFTISSNTECQAWAYIGAGSGATNVAIAAADNAGRLRVSISEFGDVASFALLGGAGAPVSRANASSTTIDSGNLTVPTGFTVLALGASYCDENENFAPGGSWSESTEGQRTQIQYQLSPATGSLETVSTIGSAELNGAAIALFGVSSGGGDGPEHLIIRRKFQGTRPRNESLLYH